MEPSSLTTKTGPADRGAHGRFSWRFSLRTLLVLSLLLAVALGFLGSGLVRVRRFHAVVSHLQALAATVTFDVGGVACLVRPGKTPPSVPWRQFLPGGAPLNMIQAVHVPATSAASSSDLAILGQLPQLAYLDLCGPRVTDQALDGLVTSQHLRQLALNETGVTGPGLARLAGVPTLGRLILRGPTVSDETLTAIPQLAALRHLRLEGTSVSSAGLKHLAGRDALRILEIRSAEPMPIDDNSLVHLAGLWQLEGLALVNVDITDAGLVHLAALRQLEWLDLAATHIRGPGLHELAELPHLRRLRLDRTEVGDDAAPLLGEMTTLHQLSMANTPITDVGLQSLGRLENLRTLILASTKVTRQGLMHLEQITQLFHLALGPGVSLREAETLKELIPACQIDIWNERGEMIGSLAGASPPWAGMEVEPTGPGAR